ncbi:MAG: RipA family octameric membrane protein [Chloroflexota bacterium]
MIETVQSTASPEDKENGRLGYQVAVDHWASQDGTTWNTFNAMLVVQSAILTVIGLVLAYTPRAWPFAIVLAAIGFTLCRLWRRMMARNFGYQNYWTYSASELEAAFLGPVRTVQRGAKFANGEEVSFESADPKQRRYHMPEEGRLPVRDAVTWVIRLLAAVQFVAGTLALVVGVV